MYVSSSIESQTKEISYLVDIFHFNYQKVQTYYDKLIILKKPFKTTSLKINSVS